MKRKSSLFFVIFFFVFWVSFSAFSSPLTLKGAIDWALLHNSSLRDITYQIDKTKRYLNQISAQRDWQVDLSIKYDVKDIKTGIKCEKTLSDTLTLEFLFPDNTISLKERLYPILPDELKKKYIEANYKLIKLKARLLWERESVKREVIKGYLDLVRKRDEYNVAKKAYTLSKKRLAQVVTLYEMKELDKTSVYKEKLAVKKAEYTLKQAKFSFEKAKRGFYNLLDLPQDKDILLREDDPLIIKLKREIKAYTKDIGPLSGSHPDLVSSALDIKLAKDQLDWTKKEDMPKIDIKADYDFDSKDFGIYLFLNYNLIDSGLKRIKEKDKEEDLRINEEKQREAFKKVKDEITDIINTIALDEILVEEDKITYEKAKYERDTVKEKLSNKASTKTDYDEAVINVEKMWIMWKSREDALFIDRLKLAQFGGYTIK